MCQSPAYMFSEITATSSSVYVLLVFKVLLENTLRVLELIKGRIDLLQNSAMPADLLPAVEKRQESIDITSKAGVNFSYIGFNLKDPLLKQLKIHLAHLTC